jgi:exodeoxyribonuclease VII small subunit
MSKINPAEYDNLSFEEAATKLEQIVNRLESGESSLEEGINLFEEGMVLAEHCQKKLKSASIKINALLEKDGELLKTAFEYEADKE